jgi:uncharacterized protein YjbI with pentapeptide repeats/very-short-patch-repair endonuclease
MDASELLKRYATGERDFSNVDLIGANLIRANLNGANLNGAKLNYTKLNYANLIGANLSVANLSEAYLIDANLKASDLFQANLSQANLISSILIGANLIDANMIGANLFDANMIGANLSGANLSGASLNKVNLSGANLSRANLNGANLSEANLSGADLSEANLSGANLMGANLFETDLTNTNLSEASLYGTILAYEKISEELEQENQDLKEKLSLLETQFEKLVEREVEKRLIANQGIKAKKSLTWKGMRFRSKPEREIAIVLDEMGVMFFPLPSGRVMTEEGMTTREVDFLVCSRGKWGILECDGGLWHAFNSITKGQVPSAALDHKRDNDFNRHGQWFIKRFTDEECKANPHKVVRQFLDMLHKFHEDQHYKLTGKSSQIKSSRSKSNHSIQYKEWGNELLKDYRIDIEDISEAIRIDEFWKRIKIFWNNSDKEGAISLIARLKFEAAVIKCDKKPN